MTLEKQLADAQRNYTGKHPEIQRLEAQLATARIDQAQAGRRRRPPSAAAEADQAVTELTAERDRRRARIRELQAVEPACRRSGATYQARVNSALVEQQLAPLEQAYEMERGAAPAVERYQRR